MSFSALLSSTARRSHTPAFTSPLGGPTARSSRGQDRGSLLQDYSHGPPPLKLNAIPGRRGMAIPVAHAPTLFDSGRLAPHQEMTSPSRSHRQNHKPGHFFHLSNEEKFPLK